VAALGEEMAQRDAILAEAAAAREAQILQATAQAETARARVEAGGEMKAVIDAENQGRVGRSGVSGSAQECFERRWEMPSSAPLLPLP
jgi:hypothetical protein